MNEIVSHPSVPESSVPSKAEPSIFLVLQQNDEEAFGKILFTENRAEANAALTRLSEKDPQLKCVIATGRFRNIKASCYRVYILPWVPTEVTIDADVNNGRLVMGYASLKSGLRSCVDGTREHAKGYLRAWNQSLHERDNSTQKEQPE